MKERDNRYVRERENRYERERELVCKRERERERERERASVCLHQRERKSLICLKTTRQDTNRSRLDKESRSR